MENLALILFPVMMAFAIFSDLLTLTIPNLVSVILVFGYLALSSWLGTPWPAVSMHAASGMMVLVVSFILFERGIIGGGDAKLASATALWLGLENLMEYLVVFSIIGGGFAMAILLLRCHNHSKSWPLAWLDRLADKASNRMPYGVALGLAGVLLYPSSAIWQGLTAM